MIQFAISFSWSMYFSEFNPIRFHTLIQKSRICFIQSSQNLSNSMSTWNEEVHWMKYPVKMKMGTCTNLLYWICTLHWQGVSACWSFSYWSWSYSASRSIYLCVNMYSRLVEKWRIRPNFSLLHCPSWPDFSTYRAEIEIAINRTGPDLRGWAMRRSPIRSDFYNSLARWGESPEPAPPNMGRGGDCRREF